MTIMNRLLVCNTCGSTDVNVRAWVDANTNEYVDNVDEGQAWCDECEDDVRLREETPEERKERTAVAVAIVAEAARTETGPTLLHLHRRRRHGGA